SFPECASVAAPRWAPVPWSPKAWNPSAWPLASLPGGSACERIPLHKMAELRGTERILVVGTEIGRSLTDFANGLRSLGFPVATAVRQRNPQHPSFRYDFDVHDPIRFERLFRTPWSRLKRYPFE